MPDEVEVPLNDDIKAKIEELANGRRGKRRSGNTGNIGRRIDGSGSASAGNRGGNDSGVPTVATDGEPSRKSGNKPDSHQRTVIGVQNASSAVNGFDDYADGRTDGRDRTDTTSTGTGRSPNQRETNRSVGPDEESLNVEPSASTAPFVVETVAPLDATPPKKTPPKRPTIGTPSPTPKVPATETLRLDGPTCARGIALGFTVAAMAMGEHWQKTTEECETVGSDLAELLSKLPTEIITKAMDIMPALSFAVGMTALVSEPLRIELAKNGNKNTGEIRPSTTQGNRFATGNGQTNGTARASPSVIIADFDSDIGN